MKRHLGKIIRGTKGILYNQTQTYHPILQSIEKLKISTSVQNKPIYAYKIGNGKMAVLISSGLHGNEVGTVKLAHKIINWLHSEDLRKELTFYIVPCLNPDGFALARRKPGYFSDGKKGRFNANGVDLNRNFDTPSFASKSHWNHGKNYSNSRPVFAGDRPLSEPETKGITDFILKQNIKVWFMFHNTGRDVMANKNPKAQKLARLFSEASGFRLFSDSEWQRLNQTGTPKEWCEIKKIAYFEVEGSNRWASDWPFLKPALKLVFENI